MDVGRHGTTGWEAIELVTRGGQWILGIAAVAVLAVSILRNLQAVAVAALVMLAVAVLPRVFEALVDRLQELGPAKFQPKEVQCNVNNRLPGDHPKQVARSAWDKRVKTPRAPSSENHRGTEKL